MLSSRHRAKISLLIFYVPVGLTPYGMLRPKYSYQRNTCRSHANYITTERSVLWKHKQQNGCQFELTMLLYRIFLCLSATFLKFHTKLSDNKKDNRDDCLFLFLIHFNTLLFMMAGDHRQQVLLSIHINYIILKFKIIEHSYITARCFLLQYM